MTKNSHTLMIETFRKRFKDRYQVLAEQKIRARGWLVGYVPMSRKRSLRPCDPSIASENHIKDQIRQYCQLLEGQR